MSGQPFWEQVEAAEELGQGDYLPDCFAVPLAASDPDVAPGDEFPVDLLELDLIVVTQSCDLANGKARNIAFCPIYPITEYQQRETALADKGAWEAVRQGRREGLHLLPSPDAPREPARSLVVDLREVFCLPSRLVRDRVGALGLRWRLRSPYLEHFSQAFARCYMRVALPEPFQSIPGRVATHDNGQGPIA